MGEVRRKLGLAVLLCVFALACGKGGRQSHLLDGSTAGEERTQDDQGRKPLVIEDAHFTELGAYVVDVLADEPLGLWPLDAGTSSPFGSEDDTAELFRGIVGERLALSSPIVGNISCEAWLRDARGTLLDLGAFQISIAQRQLIVSIGSEQSEPVEVPETEWFHLGVSRSTEGWVNVVVNGELRKRQLLSSQSELSVTAARIGTQESPFSGELDQLALFDRLVHHTRWRHRWLVANGERSPSTLQAKRPLSVQLQTTHDEIVQMVPHPDGTQIATVGHEGDVKLWDTTTGDVVAVVSSTGAPYLAIAFSPDGTTLGTADAWGIDLWNRETLTKLRRLGRKVQTGQYGTVIRQLAFSADGRRLLVASRDLNNQRRTWVSSRSTETEEVFWTEVGGNDTHAFSPDRQWVASVPKNGGQWVVRETENGSVVAQGWSSEGTHSKPDKTVASFHSDSERVLIAQSRQAFEVSLPEGAKRELGIEIPENLLRVGYSTSGERILLMHTKGTYVFDRESGRRLFNSFKSSPDLTPPYQPVGSNLVVRAHRKGDLLVFNAKTGQERNVSAPPEHASWILTRAALRSILNFRARTFAWLLSPDFGH